MDLRIVGLALMVSVDGMIPLFSQTYAGNQTDAVTFGSVSDELVARYRLLAREAEHITLVFDKGNNSEKNLAAFDGRTYHVIGSLVPTQHKDLLRIPLARFSALTDPSLAGTIAYRTTKEVFGRKWTIVVTRSDELLTGQLQGIAQHLGKRKKRLLELQRKLRASQQPEAKGKGYTRESLEAHAKELSQGQYLKDLLQIDVREVDGRLSITLRQKPWVMDRLLRTVLGKRILFTDNHDWTTEEIVLGYRSQHYVEASFRQMKDRTYVSVEPIRHWKDQKIAVHAFICVLALTLASLLRREVKGKGIDLSVDALLDELHGIQEIVNLYPAKSPQGGRPRTRRILSRMTRLQEQLFRRLDLARFQSS